VAEWRIVKEKSPGCGEKGQEYDRKKSSATGERTEIRAKKNKDRLLAGEEGVLVGMALEGGKDRETVPKYEKKEIEKQKGKNLFQGGKRKEKFGPEGEKRSVY